MAMFDFETRGKISRIAQEAGIEAAALLAVIEVESAGKTGTAINGRFEPLIRFEAHYFYHLLPKPLRNKAQKLHLAHPLAGRIKNPKSQPRRWAMLERAIRIDRKAALSSVSWGLGQVMGDHWNWLGYESVEALVTEARSSVSGQVRLMARFIEKSGLARKLNAHDWAGFARTYNGPAYRKNRYDKKMARAYRHHAATGRASRPAITRPQLQQGARGSAVRELQDTLTRAGIATTTDGIFGPETHAGVVRFQHDNNLAADGIVGPETWARLENIKSPATSVELLDIENSFREATKCLRRFLRL